MVDENSEGKDFRGPEATELTTEFATVKEEVDHILRYGRSYNAIDELNLVKDVYYLTILWANFDVYILSPYFEPEYPPKRLIFKEKDELLYPIFDYGDKFSTSVGEDLPRATRATGKYLETVDKIIQLAIERAKTSESWREGGGAGGEPEIRVAFAGHEIGQRKGFKSCLLSNENIVVTNFEPGEWGEYQLRTMEYLAEKGYLPGMS